MSKSMVLLVVLYSSLQPTLLEASLPATQEPLWPDTVRAVETLRFGELDGADEYTFGAIRALAVDPSGRILLYDAQVPIIRLFAADGRHAGDIGGRGEGPGEYLRVTGLRFLPSGEIAAWDLAQQRITVYDAAGAYLRTHSVCCGIAAPESFRVDDTGHYYVKAALISSTGGRPSGQWPRAYLRVTPEGELADTLRVPYEEAPDRPLVLPLPEGSRVPFVEERFHAVGPEGEL